MSKEHRMLLQSGAALALAIGGLLLPSRVDAATTFVCAPGACVADCADAEAACQVAGPRCHATGCNPGLGCEPFNEVECAIS